MQASKRTDPMPAAPAGMRRIPGGAFTMGSDRHYPEERSAHPVRVDGFWNALVGSLVITVVGWGVRTALPVRD